MKKVFIIFILHSILFYAAFSQEYIVKNDNGKPNYAASDRAEWEESVFLEPNGPCEIKEIQVYFEGNTPGKDTLFVVYDPAEGGIPPTFWVIQFNMRYDPIIVDYDGTPGWRSFPTPGLRAEGLDRICVQHKLSADGPWFAYDTDGLSDPAKSFLMDPTTTNSYGWPGNFYVARGDFLVRLVVEFDDPGNDGSAPPPFPALLDISKEAGLVDNEGNIIGSQSVSVADWNGDGWDDVALGSRFFENNRDGTFSNVTDDMNIPGFTMWGDYDNDGDPDAYAFIGGPTIDSLMMVATQNTIFRNEGSGSFTRLDPKDVFMLPYPNPGEDLNGPLEYTNDSIHNPYICWAPVWFDYNGDGFIDLFLGNRRSLRSYPNEVFNPDQLWKNNGDGTFSLVTDESGIEENQRDPGQDRNQNNIYYNGQDASACDFNMDNKIDLHMINYGLERDFLYRNNDDGTFSDVASDQHIDGHFDKNPNPESMTHAHACEWADFNNDGYPDVMVGNLAHPDWRGWFSNPSMIYKNNGPPDWDFTEVGSDMGLKFFESDAGVLWIDYDSDGWQDLWIGQSNNRLSHLYRNEGPPDFKLREVTWLYGSVTNNCWSAARIDFDNDGDMDMLIKGRLYRNDIERKGNWVSFRVEGSPKNHVPADGFGTKILLKVGDKVFYRDLMGTTAGPRHRQNTNELFIGLGEVDNDDNVKLTVTYPNGEQFDAQVSSLNVKYRIPYMGPIEKLGPYPPGLIRPRNGTVFRKGESSAVLCWASYDAENYQMMISLSEDFDELIYRDSIYISRQYESTDTINGRNFRTTEPGRYYWKVGVNKTGEPQLWSSTWEFLVCDPSPLTTVLTSPEDDTNELGTKPLLDWYQPEDEINCNDPVKFELQVSMFSTFEITIVIDTLEESQYLIDIPLQPETEYFWRVRAANGDFIGDGLIGQWSEVFSFTTIALPNKPLLTEPPDQAEDVRKRPLFKWEILDNADNYEIQVARDEGFENIVYEKDAIPLNRTSILSGIEYETRYYWHVRGHNEGGPGEWSDTWSFVTEPANSVDEPAPVLLDAEIVPNPLNNTAKIFVFSADATAANIDITNSVGQIVNQLDDKQLIPGTNEFSLDASNMSAGIYFCRIKAGGFVIVRKIVVLR